MSHRFTIRVVVSLTYAAFLGLITPHTNGAAIAVCVGLNAVDPDQYEGWSGNLQGCENDARDMLSIAQSAGFTGKTLLTKEATRDAVLKEIRKAADSLQAGDIFLLSCSSHGGQVRDANGDEVDSLDETWCLYDGELIDDELYAEWAKFHGGVRILVFADSCHSGTITKATAQDFAGNPTPERFKQLEDAYMLAMPANNDRRRIVARGMPPKVAIQVYKAHKNFYDGLQKGISGEGKTPLSASVLSVSACKDAELSGDGPHNGVFTGAVKAVWADGAYQGNYDQFTATVRERAIQDNPDQTAMKQLIDKPNPPYESQRPFTIAAPT